MRRPLLLCFAVLPSLALAVSSASCGSSDSSSDDQGSSAGGSGSGGKAGQGGSGGASGKAGQAGQAGQAGASGQGGSSGKAGASGQAGQAGQAGGSGQGGSSGKAGASGQAGQAGASGQAGSGGASGQAGAAGKAGSGGGPLTCTGTQKDCGGGACSDLQTDAKNCGACGKACDAGGSCCGGVCVGTGSCDFSVTKVEPATAFQNGGSWAKLTGAGFVEGMSVFIGDARAPVEVVDDKHATIQIPPGPAGVTDVKISAGPVATLKGAFTYLSAGLSDKWEQKPLSSVRGEDPALALMQDGRVLVAGGTVVPDAWNMSLDTAEIYTRTTDTVTPAKGKMSTPRWQNSAVTLLNGKVLVVGGNCLSESDACAASAKLADVFDPATDTFAKTAGDLTSPRIYTRAVLLPDGRVLVSSSNVSGFDVYEPKSNKFTALPHTQLHAYGFMVRLRDGRVLIGGGDGGVTAAEIFDPDTNTITPTGPLNQGRSMLTAHTLPDGRVIVIGGASTSAGGIDAPLDSVELYDPAAGTFSVAPYKLSVGRCWHASALVRDGTVLVMGGYDEKGKCSSLTASVDQIDPAKATSQPFSDILNKNTEWTAVTLLDGSVLGVGGGACGTNMALPDIDFLAGKD